MKKARRRIGRIQWRKSRLSWEFSQDGLESQFFRTKLQAIERGAVRMRWLWEQLGDLSQLVIYNRNGRIASERTFGKDPVRHSG